MSVNFRASMTADGTTITPSLKEQGQSKKELLEKLAVQTLGLVIDKSDEKFVPEKMDALQKKLFTEKILEAFKEILEEEKLQFSHGDKQGVIQYVFDEIFGYGPINALIQDPGVSEIMVNGYDNIYVERQGKLEKTEITFRDNAHVSHTINKIINPLGRRVDESCPTVDARLPDGSRVNAIIAPLALRGPCVTIRKFSADPYTVENLINFGSLTREMAAFLSSAVRARENIIVSGGTGSGKTTTLNVISGFIPETERIVTIEDTAELQLHQDNLVPLESRPANMEGKGEFTIRELVMNSLRMRPDRIVVGEVRGGEALDMLQAMNTGHDGSISTLHANSPRDALARLETMVLMAGLELPLRAIREQINSAVGLIVHQARFNDGSRKITHISEVTGLEGDTVKLQDIFIYKQESLDGEGRVQGSHVPTGFMPLCLEKMRAFGEHFEMEAVPGFAAAAAPVPAAEATSPECVCMTEEEENIPLLQSGENDLIEIEKGEAETSAPAAKDGPLEKKDDVPDSPAPVSCHDESLSQSFPGKSEAELASPIYLKTEAPARGEIGEEISFSIYLVNRGKKNLENINLTDELLSWKSRIDILAPGESREFETEYIIPGDRGSCLKGTTVVRAESMGGEKVETGFDYSVQVLAPQVEIVVQNPAEGISGDTVSLAFTVTNSSIEVDLVNLQISDPSLDWSEQLELLPARESGFFQVQYQLPRDSGEAGSVVSVFAESRFGQAAMARQEWSFPVMDGAPNGGAAAPDNGAHLTLVKTDSVTGQPCRTLLEENSEAARDLAMPLVEEEMNGETPSHAQDINKNTRKALSVPAGMHGFAIPVNATTDLCKFMQPGDRVDVLAVSPAPEGNPVCSTLENAFLLAIEEPTNGKTSATVMLAVTLPQLQTLACALPGGTFHLLLRPQGG